MHTLVFVTVSADRTASSKEVCSKVFCDLVTEGFVHPGWLSGSWGDWFVIGGRWSGELVRRLGEPAVGGEHPNAIGQDDDAGIVTRELYDACLKPFEGENQQRPSWKSDGLPGFIDLDAEEVSPETHIAPAEGYDAGTVKWLVTVDLHG